jgi:hypothetical protein
MVGSSGDVKQGTTAGATKGSAGVRALVVAEKRVTAVERRSAGRQCPRAGEGHVARADVVPQGCARRCGGEPLGQRLVTGSGRPQGPAHRKSADWRAGCGRSARPVWEGGEARCASPIPR